MKSSQEAVHVDILEELKMLKELLIKNPNLYEYRILPNLSPGASFKSKFNIVN